LESGEPAGALAGVGGARRRGTETVETRYGKVVINLGPVVDRVRARLAELGIGIFDDVSGEGVSREFVLFESDSLSTAVGRFVGEYRVALRLVVLGLGLLLLVALSRPGPAAVLIIAVVVALGLGLIGVLGRARPKTTGPTA
jgi:hypothetical protein